MMTEAKHRQNLRTIYSSILSVVGLILAAIGGFQIPTYDQPGTFLLLLILAIATQSTMTYLVGGSAIVSVSTAISFATVPLYGPFAAALVAAVAEFGLWVISIRSEALDWKKEIERLGVNIGMNTIAVVSAGLGFTITVNWLGSNTFLGQTIPWIVGAAFGDQVNLWLLAVIIFLVNGVSPYQVWKENKWAIPINILVMSAGGGLLSIAVHQFGWLGIAIFFLPIVLSAYSFRLTVNNTKKHLEQLEDLVAERTKDLEEANEELASLAHEKDQFLAVLTHDMRTPLTSIKGYASILRDRDMSRDQQIHIAKVVLKSQDTLLEIVNNILEIEKLQSGTPVLLEMNDFDLALLAQSVAELLDAPASEKNIVIHYDEVPSPIVVKADEQKLQRVITNLISNAIKYTPEGGEVFVETSLNGRYAHLAIRDTGYGIPADELPQIFDRYSRVKKHQTVAIGTGLGLAIVKSLVEAHGGEILVTSVENEGSTFTVKLPVQ